jgi:photosystem II stability/assembly factor-like uncharacterized protein
VTGACAAAPRRTLRRAVTVLLAVFALGGRAQTPVPRPAEPARLAAHALLIALARAGERLVAVGDRGIIVLSDDQGASWHQADRVPVQALLTGVCFRDAQHGIAVGHDEAILISDDAGKSWRLSHYAPQAQRPLLDVWCGADGASIAVGAYSSYLVSDDGGVSWSAAKFTPQAAPTARPAAQAASDADEESANGGYHLNRIVAADGARLYIAGEAGHLYRSDDRGVHWQQLPSPYAGSFFDVLPLQGDDVLALGLRGSLYRSTDAGASWQKIDTGTVAMLDGGVRLADGTVALVGLAGVVLVSHDGGRSMTLLQQPDYAGLSAALGAGTGQLAAVGERGARQIALGGTARGTP